MDDDTAASLNYRYNKTRQRAWTIVDGEPIYTYTHPGRETVEYHRGRWFTCRYCKTRFPGRRDVAGEYCSEVCRGRDGEDVRFWAKVDPTTINAAKTHLSAWAPFR